MLILSQKRLVTVVSFLAGLAGAAIILFGDRAGAVAVGVGLPAVGELAPADRYGGGDPGRILAGGAGVPGSRLAPATGRAAGLAAHTSQRRCFFWLLREKTFGAMAC